jgi:hypothetical protein
VVFAETRGRERRDARGTSDSAQIAIACGDRESSADRQEQV